MDMDTQGRCRDASPLSETLRSSALGGLRVPQAAEDNPAGCHHMDMFSNAWAAAASAASVATSSASVVATSSASGDNPVRVRSAAGRERELWMLPLKPTTASPAAFAFVGASATATSLVIIIEPEVCGTAAAVSRGQRHEADLMRSHGSWSLDKMWLLKVLLPLLLLFGVSSGQPVASPPPPPLSQSAPPPPLSTISFLTGPYGSNVTGSLWDDSKVWFTRESAQQQCEACKCGTHQ